MPSRKRPIQAEEDAVGVTNGDDAPAALVRIRNMWQFANLCQWIYIFGKAAKIDESIDIEEIEADCLKPQQNLLVDLALAILKLVSSHRGLNHDILDDQLHKQYLMRAPDRAFGNGDNRSNKFCDLSVCQKRIEPYGWDKEDRTYFVLDDNRVYRLTEAPPTQARSKPKSKPAKSARAGRRNRTTETDMTDKGDDDGLGGKMWECVAVTLQDVQSLLGNFAKTRDENEKILRRQLQTHLVPILEKMEEAQKRKQAQKERELLNLAKMANAKRSSRIAGKVEKRKLEEQAKEDELKERQSEVMKVREEQKRQRLERDRDFRMFSRQRRLQEREARRLQHKEELAQLSEDSRHTSTGAGRMSERRLEAEIEKKKQSLEDLDREEEEWAFDCICGLFGHVDDGTHCVACERCNVWQHSGCLGISEAEADRPEFQFVCDSCKRQDGRPFKMVKLKLNPSRSTASSRAEQALDTQSMEQRAPCDDSSKPCSGAPLSGDGGSAPNVPEPTSSLLVAPTASEPVSQLTPGPSEEARNAISAVNTGETSAAGNLLKQNGDEPLPRPPEEPQLDKGDSGAKAHESLPTTVP
ncbi:hypothetical protein CDD80_4786 [Ophiocordyceps camponoti-rufipedis]|uniref:Zinc finger PHD-type domain-containing protein n=1 Tax=Ophiocordyceps camponoti-rufipedis TaxID=2004952 RepID=A0A2C5ZI80_9HYPO|nr:hypothetical protein CDD80_4786 [Ophiocordyceps camponoti-rufipedis]